MSDHQAHDHGQAHQGSGHGQNHGDDHGHEHGHFDEAEWARWAAETELQGEVLLGFVTGTAKRVMPLWLGYAPSRIFDIGSGPGVAACELARLFPTAEVVAVDSSPAMLERADRRILAHELSARVTTALAEFDDIAALGPADLIWASMALHHVGDEVAALRTLRESLSEHGVLAIAEVADPMRVLPDDLGIGNAGLASRVEHASAGWFSQMRHHIPSSVESADLAVMITDAGYTIIDDRIDRIHFEPPLSADAQKLAAGQVNRTLHQLSARLDHDDLTTLNELLNDANPLSVMRRTDLFIDASQRIVIARPARPVSVDE
jgi:ubiquinone/menaquinone biosynthesis C-methylase UbiE